MMPRHPTSTSRSVIQAAGVPRSSTGNMEACLEKLSIDHNMALSSSNLLLSSSLQGLEASSSVLPNKSIVELLAGESTATATAASCSRNGSGGVTPEELIEWNMNEESTRDLAAALAKREEALQAQVGSNESNLSVPDTLRAQLNTLCDISSSLSGSNGATYGEETTEMLSNKRSAEFKELLSTAAALDQEYSKSQEKNNSTSYSPGNSQLDIRHLLVNQQFETIPLPPIYAPRRRPNRRNTKSDAKERTQVLVQTLGYGRYCHIENLVKQIRQEQRSANISQLQLCGAGRSPNCAMPRQIKELFWETSSLLNAFEKYPVASLQILDWDELVERAELSMNTYNEWKSEINRLGAIVL